MSFVWDGGRDVVSARVFMRRVLYFGVLNVFPPCFLCLMFDAMTYNLIHE